MSESLVLTIVAADRPGLVESVAACVADNGGNWVESRMCRLAGQFAGVARVTVPAGRRTAVEQALRNLEKDGFRVLIAAGTEPAAAAGSAATLDVVGHDRPGILRAVTHLLAVHGVNVEELASECVPAPMGGGELFQARARVRVPADVRLETVRRELEKIAADLMVDLRLQAD